MNTPPSTPLPPEVRARAEALVKKYFAECFWFWRPDVTVETSDTLDAVIRYLREYGGKQGWRDAAELRKCL